REPALEEGARVDARRRVALDVDGIAGESAVLAPEEPVEPDVVEGGRRGEGRQMTSEALGLLVGTHDHRGRVPADVGPDAPLEVLVPGEPRLTPTGDRVDVRRRDRRRRADLALARPLQERGHPLAR